MVDDDDKTGGRTMMLKAMFGVTALLTAMPLAAQTTVVAPPTAKIALTRTEDLRCLLLVSQLIGTGTAEQKEAGTKAALYFAGKILGASPVSTLPPLPRPRSSRWKRSIGRPATNAVVPNCN
ncbi:hypothetical protein AB5I39_05830 [Sphingomonas sp. MMS24-J45]|uniref:hypothetical protein n=1 Tax=Sphingomonas sp. MMS24-J45 TaxID=3238806 RepID=UPI0038514D6F